MDVRKVAVIVPVRDDPDGLESLLRCIAAQDFPSERTLVFVAVDGGDPATMAVAERFGHTPIAITPARGSYNARNVALAQLPDDVDVVAFTDGDCLPAPGWITGHIAALGSADMSGGAIDVTLSAKPHPAELVDKTRHLQQRGYVTRDNYAATANLAVRRAVVDDMQFDSSLQTGGDVEFGRRATAAGYRLVYSPEALVAHPARETTAELMRKIDRICNGMAAREAYWNGRQIRPARLRRDIVRAALRAGVSRNPLWLAHAMWLEYRCQRRLVRSAVRAGAVVTESPRPLTVAYLVDRPAELSQTFITGELEELRRQGARVVMVAVDEARNGRAPEVPTLVLRKLSHPRRLLRGIAAYVAFRHPLRWLSFLRSLDEVQSEIGGLGIPKLSLPFAGWWLRRQKVDVLHAHFAWRGAAAAMSLSRLTGIPWSMTLHANDIFNDRRNLDAKLRSADRLITVCDYNKRFLHDELCVTRDVDLVVCGVDVPTLAPAERDIDIVAVGRLVDKKGFDLLLDALFLPALRALVNSVVIVGEGPLDEELRKQVADLGLADIVQFVGAQSHAETLATISRSRLLCLPARIAANGDRDSMPVVVKEAMAAGVPVVASDAVGIPEMVDDTVGRLVPASDARALADALCEVLRLPEPEREALGAAGRERVVEKFTMAAQVAKLRQLLAETGKCAR